MMSRRLTLVLVFLFAFCLSVMSVFAQEADNSTAGETEVQSFFNNFGVNAQVETNTLPEPRTDEANWCTQANRWGDGRCNHSDTWVHRYNWWIGWVLAHCEIPGYFPPEDFPEECDWMLGASSVDDIFAGLYYVSPSNNSSVNGLGNSGSNDGVVTTPVPTETSTDTPTEEPTDVPTDTPTDVPTDTPTEEPTDVPTDTPTDTPTEEPTDVPTDTPTEEPTDVPTDTPTEEPTDIPTDEPTDTPTEEPTDVPTDTPTEEPTDVPTDTPTEEPTDTPYTTLTASMVCSGDGSDLTLTVNGDGPFDVTGSGRSLPLTASVGSTTITSPGSSTVNWTNIVVTETSGDFESISLGNLTCS